MTSWNGLAFFDPTPVYDLALDLCYLPLAVDAYFRQAFPFSAKDSSIYDGKAPELEE